jgi:hypothetical protein
MARVLRGVTHVREGATDEAFADFRHVIRDTTSPAEERAKARLGRADAYGREGMTDEALADLNAVIDDPTSPARYRLLARQRRGLHFPGAGAADEAIGEDPASSAMQPTSVLLKRGMTYFGEGETAKAITEFNFIIDDPTSSEDQRLIARLYRDVAARDLGP